MESSAAVAHVAASRQKNCNSCVQLKKRCDRRMPVCSRCAEKKITCIYSKRNRVASRPERNDADEPTPYTETLPFGSPAYSLFGPAVSLDVDYLGSLGADSRLDATVEYTPQSSADPPNNNDIPMGSFMDLIGNSDFLSSDQWLVSAEEGPVVERPSTPMDEGIERAYQKMAPFCDEIEPWHLYDPKTPLHYVMSRVKGFTTDMANHSATPFLHRYLYHDFMPQSIMACFATNVLYANRTPANTAMVMRAIHGSVRELVDANVSRTIATPIEKLARTQALFMYQIIRLFDGDIALRAQGEKDIPLLRTWLGELCKIRENLGGLAQIGESAARKQPPPMEWERWIFAESVRRTIVMAYSVLTLYELAKAPDPKESLDPWAYIHRWTLARSLWEASSSVEFHRRWKETPHFIIANYSFEDFLEHGRGEDVDDFAEILLGVYIGVDATKEFIS